MSLIIKLAEPEDDRIVVQLFSVCLRCLGYLAPGIMVISIHNSICHHFLSNRQRWGVLKKSQEGLLLRSVVWVHESCQSAQQPVSCTSERETKVLETWICSHFCCLQPATYYYQYVDDTRSRSSDYWRSAVQLFPEGVWRFSWHWQ